MYSENIFHAHQRRMKLLFLADWTNLLILQILITNRRVKPTQQTQGYLIIVTHTINSALYFTH
jgi:hypothetical protein